MKYKAVIISVTIILVFVIAGYWTFNWYSLKQMEQIIDFQSCSAAHSSVMIGSYPERCLTRDARFFVDSNTYEEAVIIAQDSECLEKGQLTNSYFYNEGSGSWWIDLEMKDEFKQSGCNPACVVTNNNRTAEINWRCTGLVLPE